MKSVLFATALLLTAAASPSPVSIASGDWSDIPLAEKRGNLRVSTRALERIANAFAEECNLGGESKRIELTVPFLIEFSAHGTVKQVVIHRFQCPPAEALLGGALLELARSGAYRPTGENREHWYRGEFSLVWY